MTCIDFSLILSAIANLIRSISDLVKVMNNNVRH